METILIAVSVLSTLAVVAIVLSVVVILNKLKDKVDVEIIDDVMRECDHIRDDLEIETSKINNRIDELEGTIYRKIDSRNDKLHDHICKEVENLYREINNNQKVLLKD